MANEETAPDTGARKTFQIAICGAQSLADGETKPYCCEREPGHLGQHAAEGRHWSAAPPLGPVPERMRPSAAPDLHGTFERARAKCPAVGVSVDPDSMTRTLLAGLVACGRSLGRLDAELIAQRHWRLVVPQVRRHFTTDARKEPTEIEWAKVGRYLFAQVQMAADMSQSEPAQPIQERAEALAILILQGHKPAAPANFLIRAGAVLEVLRGIWRKAKAGQS